MRRTQNSRERAEAFDFCQSGFPISFSVSTAAVDSSTSPVFEALVYEVLTPNSLECGGGLDGGRFQGFVTRWKGSADEVDRREVSEWLRRRPEVDDYEVGNLVQAWHGV
jgi:uncharacterized protein YggL (DUF469 family)